MKEFCLGILMLYFGIKLVFGFISLSKWDNSDFVESAKILNITKQQMVNGVVEHLIMIIISISLYLF